MDRKEQVGVDAVDNVWDLISELCSIESAPALWEEISHGIPAWHPRMEGDGDDGSGDGDGTDDGDAGDGDGDGKDAAQIAVDKAHAKLREAEKERDKLKAELNKATRKDMEETERLKAELEDARLEAASLQDKIDKAERVQTIKNIAEAMKFKKPGVASRFVDADVTDEKGIRAALKAAIADIPELVGSGTPPPPINPDNKDNNGSQNARMNAALRKAAGRA